MLKPQSEKAVTNERECPHIVEFAVWCWPKGDLTDLLSK
jgi:hypothetical protein